MATLLGAPVHEPILADVQVTASGTAVPVVWLTVREVLLKSVVVREVERGRAGRDDLLEDRALMLVERLQLPAVVVDDPDRGRESELTGAPRDRPRIVRSC